mmetsp:Transcript_90352/g.260327  ORF Transcript_90352/g.260327 Transcript_90352/m.260327 type:complete len:294 (+) Transcript_90352:2853-3734(+)
MRMRRLPPAIWRTDGVSMTLVGVAGLSAGALKVTFCTFRSVLLLKVTTSDSLRCLGWSFFLGSPATFSIVVLPHITMWALFVCSSAMHSASPRIRYSTVTFRCTFCRSCAPQWEKKLSRPARFHNNDFHWRPMCTCKICWFPGVCRIKFLTTTFGTHQTCKTPSSRRTVAGWTFMQPKATASPNTEPPSSVPRTSPLSSICTRPRSMTHKQSSSPRTSNVPSAMSTEPAAEKPPPGNGCAAGSVPPFRTLGRTAWYSRRWLLRAKPSTTTSRRPLKKGCLLNTFAASSKVTVP